MNHGSLFSGIGGFDLAAEWMGWTNVFHCEWEEFPRKVLNYHFPKSISYGDIKKTDFTIHRGQIDILTGGFPCQPYSAAGKRLGKEDDRHLWPEMLRAIREIQPGWVVGENVYGIINWNGGLVFEEVQTDLEAEGYEVQSFILPAASVNAPHRRDRAWFVAKNTNSDGWSSSKWEKNPTSGDSGTLAQEIMSGYQPTIEKLKMLPTPTTATSGTSKERPKGQPQRKSELIHLILQIAEKCKMLPTPTASDTPAKNTGKRNQDSIPKRIRDAGGKTSQLNPLFVEEMMGFPESWTLSPFLNGETNQSKPTEMQ